MSGSRFVIIGAGPTGLGAACALHESGERDWHVLESSETAGGLAGSVTDEHGFTWDFGGHVSFSKYAEFNSAIVGTMATDEWLLHQRRASVSLDGVVTGFPIQHHLHQLPDSTGLAIPEESHGRTLAPSNFAQWCEEQFGPGLVDRFFRPYNEKLWQLPLEQLSAAWMSDRVAPPKTNSAADSSWGPNKRFRYPSVGGNGEPWRRLAAKVASGGRLRFGARVVGLDLEHRRLDLDDGSDHSFEFLISTIPIDCLAKMIVPHHDDLCSSAERLVRTSTHLVGVRCAGPIPAEATQVHWRYFADPDTPFYRATVLSNYSPSNAPTGYWSILTETAARGHQSAPTVSAIVEALVREDLLPSAQHCDSVWQKTLRYGYPVPTLSRDEVLSAMHQELESAGVFSRGRFGGWKYEVSNQDHSFLQGSEVVRRILTGTSETIYRHSGA